MSGFFIFIGILALIGYADKFINTPSNTKTIPTKSDAPKNSTSIKTYDYEEKNNETKNQSHTNNVYIQNNVYVNTQQPKSSTKHTDHTEKVWNQLGYVVKEGETYAYKHYGNKIYRPDQVLKSSSNKVRYSEEGLARKLINDTGSKKFAKDILVKEYGFSESSAKNLVGYRGY